MIKAKRIPLLTVSQSVSQRTQRNRDRMDMKQVVTFLLFLVPLWACKTHKCYEDHELSDAANRKLMSHYPQPPEPLSTAAADTPSSCPLALYEQQLPQHISDRSVSPWRYVLVTMKDHFPSTYAEAQCLCSGCILIQDKAPPQMSNNYNSVPIKQSRVFLKKERCCDEDKYYLRPVRVEVTVGCTCVRVKSS